MKKVIALILIVILLFSSVPNVFASGDVGVYLNGEKIEKEGMIISDRTYLPVRALCEKLGIKVDWIDATKSVVLGEKPDMTLYTGSVNIYLNGTLLENAQAVIIDGSTYLPVRALCEEMNMNVEWNGETREVFVTWDSEFFTSPGVVALDESLKKQLAAYMTTNLPNGDGFRSALEEMIENGYYNLSKQEQTDAVKAILETPLYTSVPFPSSSIPDEKAGYTCTFTQYDPSYDVWRGSCVPVWEYEIIMDGKGDSVHKWKLISTVENEDVVNELAEMIAFFPYGVRQYLDRLIFMTDSVNTCYAGSNTLWVKVDYIVKSEYLYRAVTNCMGYLMREAHNKKISPNWIIARIDDVIPVSNYGNTNDTLDLGEFARLYFSLKEDEKLLEDLKALYPNRFKVFAAMLYASDNELYAKYYTQYQMITNLAYTGEAQESFTISIPGTNLYLTAPAEKEQLLPTFEEYTGEENQLWTRKLYEGHSVITSFATDQCLFASRGYYNPITKICTTVGGVMGKESYVIMTENGIYFTEEKGYLGTGEKYAYLSDEEVVLDIRFKE